MSGPSVAVLCGGVGAARFLRGLLGVVAARGVTAIVNTGDDTVLHGLAISPDLDTITYTLAEAVNPETGWGLVGETWQAMDALRRYADAAPSGSAAGATWFGLGDRDLATHLYRTGRLAEGATLGTVTSEIVEAWGLELALVPVTDDPLRTRIRLVSGEEVEFQDYFVRRRHAEAVAQVHFEGAATARPAPAALEAISRADVVVLAPSNPIVSLAPVLAVPGVRDAVEAARDRTVAVSPIIAGAAVKGPADRLLRELGHDPSSLGIARLYADLAATLIVDDADAGLCPAIEAAGLRCVVAPTLMSSPERSRSLARVALAAAGVPVPEQAP